MSSGFEDGDFGVDRILTPTLRSSKEREKEAYKALPTNTRKPGVKFIVGSRRRTFFWCDLRDVDYEPMAVDIRDADSDEETHVAIESITFFFIGHTVTIKGYRLWRIDDDCQQHMIDSIKLSSREAIMDGPLGSRDDPPTITSIEIKEVKKGR